MNSYVREIVEDVLIQAHDGLVQIKSDNGDPWKFFTHFYCKIEDNPVGGKVDNSQPIVFIPNYKVFLKKIEKFLNVSREFHKQEMDYFELHGKEFDKKLFLDLIVSASNYDLVDILDYVDKRTKMTQQNLSLKEFKMGEYQGCEIWGKISKNQSNLESPYRFNVAFSDGENSFKLPSVLFGVVDGEAQIMGIQNFNKENQNPLSKKLDRFFRKVNKDVDMTDDMSKISPNALVSFTLFNEYLKKCGIRKEKFYAFMPIRYYCQKEVGFHKAKNEEERIEFLEKHNKDQYNMMDKVFNMFFRFEHHFDNSQVDYNDMKQEISLSFKDEKATETDNIISQIAKSVDCGKIEENESF